MSDVKKLIELILSDDKLSRSAEVYRDEPILKTASQMSGFIPQKYREMKKLAKSYDASRQSEAWLFCTQGKFMEDFEDDFEYHGEFVRYFPTYRAMSDLQLRGYFSWRTKVRRGIIEETSLSFVFVYIYELLNLIGVTCAQEGFETLQHFWSEYAKINSALNRYMQQWLSDFVVYYNLDKSLLASFGNTAFDDSMLTLLNYEANDTDTVFEALSALSSYNIAGSRFFKEYPQDVKEVCCAAFARLSEYYGKSRKSGLCDKLFGRVFEGNYYMFSAAVFYDRMKYESFDYVINDIDSYSCRDGIWTSTKFYGNRDKSRELGSIMRTVDCLMREKYAYPSPIVQGKSTKIVLNIVGKEIDKYLEIKKKNAVPKIEIDVTKLSDIRRASLETQDKLIIDEQADEEFTEEAAPPVNQTSLSDTEYTLTRLLLCGEEYAAFVKESGCILSVLIDSINEKLFDTFGDTVIVFNGDEPEVLEDYAEELKGIIK